MAVYRKEPKCPFCGEITHKASYKDMSNVPVSERVYGDNFLGWIPLEHKCEEEEKFKDKVKEIWKSKQKS